MKSVEARARGGPARERAAKVVALYANVHPLPDWPLVGKVDAACPSTVLSLTWAPEQTANVLATVKKDQLAREGKEWSAEEEQSFKEPILRDYNQRSSSVYSSARLWDDGIIDPADTRRVLGLSLAICNRTGNQETNYGVFRM